MGRAIGSINPKVRLNVPAGTKYGMLTVISESPVVRLPSGQINRVIKCKCDCGTVKDIRLLHLVRSRITSCGCERPKHGEVGSALHTCWRGMINRVEPTHINADRYFFRGITLHEPWRKYLVFREWALDNGFESGLQIDRRNNDMGYYPDNCQFVTPTENANNKELTIRVKYKGEVVSFMMLLYRLNLVEHRAAIRGRIERGWNADKAFDTPIRVGNYKRGNRNGVLSA